MDEVVNLLMYCGPTVNEIIQDAVRNDNCFYTEEYQDVFKVIVNSTLPYDIKIEDQYWYDTSRNLIKQIVILNGIEKVVFDKFHEASHIGNL